jgi:hypothetical protein
VRLNVKAKAFKLTCLLEPDAFAGVDVPNGQPKAMLRVHVGERVVKAEVNAKSLRRVIAQLATGEFHVIIQGKLEGDVLAEAGIVAQAQVAKPAVEKAAVGADDVRDVTHQEISSDWRGFGFLSAYRGHRFA